MATLIITFGSNAGEALRQLGRAIETATAKTGGGIPDRTPTGAAVTLVIDNAPASGDTCTVQVTEPGGGAGPVIGVRG